MVEKANVRLSVRRHVSRRDLAQYNARIRASLEVSLLLGRISQRMPVSYNICRDLCASLSKVDVHLVLYGFICFFACTFEKHVLLLQHLFSLTSVCLSDTYVSRRKSAQFNVRMTVSQVSRRLSSAKKLLATHV